MIAHVTAEASHVFLDNEPRRRAFVIRMFTSRNVVGDCLYPSPLRSLFCSGVGSPSEYVARMIDDLTLASCDSRLCLVSSHAI